jgi:hypothetical protein
MQFSRLVSRFSKLGRLFLLTDWESYHDESYNSSALCVGGWLARKDTWGSLERDWKARIAYENRKSALRGFPPISRYHATYCANLKREFSPVNGWDVDRQIKLSKRLCGIIAKYHPYGIVIGGRVSEFAFPDDIDTDADTRNKVMYGVSFRNFLGALAVIMRKNYPDDRVTVFYDQSKNFDSIVTGVYRDFRQEYPDFARRIVTVAPLAWQDCIVLQAADLLAFEGLKRIYTTQKDMRKALRAALGKKTPLVIGRRNKQAAPMSGSVLHRWLEEAYDE